MFTDHLEGAPLPEVMTSAIPELTNDVPSLPFRQGWGLGLAPDARGRSRHAAGRHRRLGRVVQLLLLGGPHQRHHRGDLHAAAPVLRRAHGGDAAAVRDGRLRRTSARPAPPLPDAARRWPGYSGTPLPKKLGIKEGARLALVAAPDGFLESTLEPLPDQVELRARARGPLDVIVFFTKSPRRAGAALRQARERARPRRRAVDRVAEAARPACPPT